MQGPQAPFPPPPPPSLQPPFPASPDIPAKILKRIMELVALCEYRPSRLITRELLNLRCVSRAWRKVGGALVYKRVHDVVWHRELLTLDKPLLEYLRENPGIDRGWIRSLSVKAKQGVRCIQELLRTLPKLKELYVLGFQEEFPGVGLAVGKRLKRVNFASVKVSRPIAVAPRVRRLDLVDVWDSGAPSFLGRTFPNVTKLTVQYVTSSSRTQEDYEVLHEPVVAFSPRLHSLRLNFWAPLALVKYAIASSPALRTLTILSIDARDVLQPREYPPVPRLFLPPISLLRLEFDFDTRSRLRIAVECDTSASRTGSSLVDAMREEYQGLETEVLPRRSVREIQLPYWLVTHYGQDVSLKLMEHYSSLGPSVTFYEG